MLSLRFGRDLISRTIRGRRGLLCSACNGRPAAPCMMLAPTFIEGGRGDMVYNFYSPSKGKVVSFNNVGGWEETQLMQDKDTRVVGSSHGWLALFNSHNGGLFLTNPLSGRRVNLPPLAFDLPPSSVKPFHDQRPPKVILSCSPSRQEGEEYCRAFMIHGNKGAVAICRPGHSNEWSRPAMLRTFISASLFSKMRCYCDLVYSARRRRFLGLVGIGLGPAWPTWKELECWGLECWDISMRLEQSYKLIRKSKRHDFDFWSSRLVYEEESDQMFVVVRYHDPDAAAAAAGGGSGIMNDYCLMEVYRIDSDGGLELCSSLDGLVMFIGINQSIAVKASQFSPQLKPDCIYFSDPRIPCHHDPECQVIEVFDYRTKTCSPVYYSSRFHTNAISMPWFTPTMD